MHGWAEVKGLGCRTTKRLQSDLLLRFQLGRKRRKLLIIKDSWRPMTTLHSCLLRPDLPQGSLRIGCEQDNICLDALNDVDGFYDILPLQIWICLKVNAIVGTQPQLFFQRCL